MGSIKEEIYSKEDLFIANIYKAIGHPARIKIIQYLSGIDSCVCGDIKEVIGLSQSTISQHLKALKDVNLIKGTIKGTSTCYCINYDTLSLVANHIENIIVKQNLNLKCC